jgi:hypothetical protein
VYRVSINHQPPTQLETHLKNVRQGKPWTPNSHQKTKIGNRQAPPHPETVVEVERRSGEVINLFRPDRRHLPPPLDINTTKSIRPATVTK